MVAASLVAITVFGQLPGDTAFWRELQNFAHAPVFCVIAWRSAGYWYERTGNAASSGQYIGLFTACVGLGIGIEILQAVVGRDAELRDVLADALGVVAGLAWHAHRTPRGTGASQGYRNLGPLWSIPAAMLAAGAPLLWCVAAYAQRDMRFPVLVDYRSALDFYFLEPRNSRILNRPALPWTRRDPESGGVLLEFQEGDWPGVNVVEPTPDWTKFNTLRLVLSNLEADPLDLVVRVHDRHHNLQFEDRFNLEVSVPAGSRTQLAIPLADIASGPEARALDLTSVAGVMVFGDASPPGARVLIGKMWLE